MTNIFFIADLHFGHKNIIDYESRPFKSVQEMDEILIKNWNNTVSKKDKVFILGDFAFANKERMRQYVQQLNGLKTLILGNHDRIRTIEWWKNVGFREVIPYPIIYRYWYILSHEPVYLDQDMSYINIFGHVHSDKNYADYNSQRFCVSVERIGYKPIELNEILEKIGNGNQLTK